MVCIVLCLASVVSCEAGPRSHPIANITMNFLKGLGLGKVSFTYIPCIRAINITLLTVLNLPVDYQEQGFDGLMNSITILLSNLFDLNSTCQVSVYEISKAFAEYWRQFKDESYWEAVLRQFLGKIELWIEQTVQLKACIWYSLWGCTGLAAGRLANIIFNATPKHKDRLDDVLLEPDVEMTSRHSQPGINSDTIKMIINATFNALETSGLLIPRNASELCRNVTQDFYEQSLVVLDILVDEHNWRDALYLFFFALKKSNLMYVNCKNVLVDSIEIAKLYWSTLSNIGSLFSNMVFRSKALSSRSLVAYESIVDKEYEVLGSHIGYLISILLLP